MVSCVDSIETSSKATVDIIVVDGLVNNLAEPQIIRLNRSKADPLTSRFGTTPITGAKVEVVIDSSEIATCHETVDGNYQLPNDFKGRVGHAYQLRFTLTDGTRYASNHQIIQPVPSIDKVASRFNPKSIYPPLNGYYTAGHDLFIDLSDPKEAHNFYRWDWKLWQKQEWCRTCYQGIYSVYNVTAELMSAPLPTGNYYFYRSGNTKLLEDCYKELEPPQPSNKSPLPAYTYDYLCRTQCWEIIYGYSLNLFDDQYTNGGLITGRTVAHIPYYTHGPGLVEIRQSSLTADAYRYFTLFQQQTQNTGGLADTPPTALIGNIRNVADPNEAVVGYFSASSIATLRYWLDRKDAYGIPFGATDRENLPQSAADELFYALNFRLPIPEPQPPQQPQVYLQSSPPRPPTAICVPSDSRTPFKPQGWQD
ncbi:DUF4249 domain-containing protein [Spirosoma arcticum]